MFLKFLKFSILFIAVLNALEIENFNNLENFVCSLIEDEILRNPQTKTILIFEHENTFPAYFYEKLLKCLTQEIAKVIMDSIHFYPTKTLGLIPQRLNLKPHLILYIADSIKKVKKY